MDAVELSDRPVRRVATGGRHVLGSLVLAMAAALAVLVPSPAQAATTTVYLGDYYFSATPGGPGNTSLTVANGDEVRFVAENDGHTVEIPELGISRRLRAGESITTGPLTRAGTFSVHCAPHRGLGQETTLTVRAAPAPAPQPEPEPEPAPAPDPAPAPAPTPPPSSKAPAPAPAATTAQPAPAAPTEQATTAPAPEDASVAPTEQTTATIATPASPSPEPAVSAAADSSDASKEAVAGSDDPSVGDVSAEPVASDTGTGPVWIVALLLLPLLAGAAWVVVRRQRAVGEAYEV